MKQTKRIFAVFLTLLMVVGCFPLHSAAAGLVVKDSGFTNISTLPNATDFTGLQGVTADNKYIYSFKNVASGDSLGRFYRTDMSSGSTVHMKFTDDTSLHNFVELGHGNDMCAVVHDGVTYLYLTTMYHKSHSTMKTHSLWKFKVSGTTLKKVAYYDVVQGTTNRNFTALTLFKQTSTTVTLLAAHDANVYKVDIPINAASGTISCSKAFSIDYTNVTAPTGAPAYSYTNSSGTKMYSVQGMTYSNGRLYYVMTGSSSNTPRSKNFILVYDVSDYPGNSGKRTSLAAENIYVTSSTFSNFLEIESVVIRNGIMYFGANASKSGYYQEYDFVGKLKTTFAQTPEYTVTFCDENGTTLQTVKVLQGETATYTGATPTKAYDSTNHYTFKTWATSDGTAATLTNITANLKVYASFTPTAHTYTSKITQAATCTSTGTEVFTCSCGSSYSETVAVLDHTPVVQNAQAATCTQSGYTGDTVCDVCGTTLQAGTAIDKLSHAYNAVVKAPTCTTEGYTTHTCSLCGDSYQDTYVAALGHSYTYTDKGENHVISCTGCGDQTTEAHSFKDNVCICGAKEDALLDTGLTFYNKSMDLQSYIGVNYMIRNSVAAEYDSFYVGVKQADGEEIFLNGTAMGSTYTYFSMRTAAPQMTENLAATVYGVKDGVTYHGETVNWCVRDGVMEQMNAITDLSTEENRNRMTLMVDMLNYGAAAQIRFNNQVFNLASAKLTKEQLAYANTEIPTMSATAAEVPNAGATVTFMKEKLSLQSSIELQFVVDIGSHNINDLEARITYNGTERSVPLKSYFGSYAMIIYDGIAAKDIRENVQINVCYKTTGKAVSNTLRCSIEALAIPLVDDQADVVYSMLRYGDAANKVFG